MTGYGRNGNLIRILYLAGAAIAYFLTIWGRLRCKKGVVLCYHGVRPEQKHRFERQVILLSRRFPFVRMTFDDAFSNLLDNALPILEELQVPAIIFAVTDNLGDIPRWNIPAGHPEAQELTMTAQQLLNISKHPLIRIGSHTLTHPDLTKISHDRLQAELAESKSKLEKLLGCPIEDMALPHGAYNEEVIALAQAAGYKRIFTLDPRPTDFESGSAVMGRFSLSPDVWPIEFYLTCAGAYAGLYPWRRFIRRFRCKLQKLRGR
jgi:peptidoglycan/xylan/chitin deacetylase (PgdA/CDA1 family)